MVSTHFYMRHSEFTVHAHCTQMGDNKAAIRHFDEVLRVDPSLGVAYLTRSSHTRTPVQSDVDP